VKINPEQVRLQISNLLLQFPELEGDEVLRADMIEAETEAPELLGMLLRRIGETKATAEGTKAYVAELTDRKNRLERRVDGIRALIHKIMDDAQLSKLELDVGTISIRAGTPKVMILDEAELPEECFQVTRTPHRTLIK
jgi:hypothetical protein